MPTVVPSSPTIPFPRRYCILLTYRIPTVSHSEYVLPSSHPIRSSSVSLCRCPYYRPCQPHSLCQMGHRQQGTTVAHLLYHTVLLSARTQVRHPQADRCSQAQVCFAQGWIGYRVLDHMKSPPIPYPSPDPIHTVLATPPLPSDPTH